LNHKKKLLDKFNIICVKGYYESVWLMDLLLPTGIKCYVLVAEMQKWITCYRISHYLYATHGTWPVMCSLSCRSQMWCEIVAINMPWSALTVNLSSKQLTSIRYLISIDIIPTGNWEFERN
jgi:hypothetical protein